MRKRIMLVNCPLLNTQVLASLLEWTEIFITLEPTSAKPHSDYTHTHTFATFCYSNLSASSPIPSHSH